MAGSPPDKNWSPFRRLVACCSFFPVGFALSNHTKRDPGKEKNTHVRTSSPFAVCGACPRTALPKQDWPKKLRCETQTPNSHEAKRHSSFDICLVSKKNPSKKGDKGAARAFCEHDPEPEGVRRSFQAALACLISVRQGLCWDPQTKDPLTSRARFRRPMDHRSPQATGFGHPRQGSRSLRLTSPHTQCPQNGPPPPPPTAPSPLPKPSKDLGARHGKNGEEGQGGGQPHLGRGVFPDPQIPRSEKPSRRKASRFFRALGTARSRGGLPGPGPLKLWQR